MNIALAIVQFLVNEILSVPAFLIGIITAVGMAEHLWVLVVVQIAYASAMSLVLLTLDLDIAQDEPLSAAEREPLHCD